MMVQQNGEHLRDNFLGQFTLQHHLANLAEAIHSVEETGPSPSLNPVPQAS